MGRRARRDEQLQCQRLALVAGMQFSASSPGTVATALVGPSASGTTSGFNFAFASQGSPTTTRTDALASASYIVKRGQVPLGGRVDNVGDVANLTFARYDADTANPLSVYTDPGSNLTFFPVTRPYVFAVFDPASVANLTGRLQFKIGRAHV